MKVLDLRLKGVYYDLISAGKKKHEYRKIDDYYIGRLIGGVNMQEKTEEEKEELIKILRNPDERDDYMKKEGMYYRVGDKEGAYTHVRFRRGALNTFMTVEIENIEINGGQFVITLGKIVSK